MQLFSSFPVLTTERLALTQIGPEDEQELFTLRTDDSVNKYLDRLKARSIDDVRKFIQKIQLGINHRELLYWGIHYKNGSPLLGTICLWNISPEERRAEIGYELLPTYQGKGIMQEALAAVIKYCFDELAIDTLAAETHTLNEKSSGLLQRLGFQRNPDREKYLAETEKRNDTYQFNISRETFKPSGA